MSDSNAVNKDRENKQNLSQFVRWSLILSCTVEDGGQEEHISGNSHICHIDTEETSSRTKHGTLLIGWVKEEIPVQRGPQSR